MAPLTLSGLEQVYDTLAEAIDRVPDGRGELFLTKLALLLSQELGDPKRIGELIEAAMLDL